MSTINKSRTRTNKKAFEVLFILLIVCNTIGYSTPPPPTNDDPCSAAPLSVGVTCSYQTFTNVGATETPTTLAPGNVTAWPYHPASYYEHQGSFQAQNYQDVWFSVVVPASGNLQIQIDPNTTAHRGIGLCAYTGTSCSSLAPFRTITVVDTVNPIEYPVLRIYPWDNLAGQTLWIRFWPHVTEVSGSFDICATEPSISDQMLITPLTNMSLNYLVNQVFSSAPCDSVFNAVYAGSANSAGYFTNGSLTGFSEGIALSSGLVSNIRGNGMNIMSNDNVGVGGDSQLNSLSSANGMDASVLTFSYIPSTDTMKFRYIFGSEEYSRFVSTGVNDVFGFFISGPNPSGGTYNSYNFALVNSQMVSINTINNGQHRYESYGPCTNCVYFRDNFNGSIPVSWNGLTVTLEAKVAVVPCATYSLKMGVQDIQDSYYDCGLLFEAKSGLPPGTGNMMNFDAQGNQTSIVEEGCSYFMVFMRPDTINLADSLAFYPNISGNVTSGVDYSGIPNPVWFEPGQMTDTVYYDVYSDANVEANEYITLNISGGCPCTPTTVFDTIYFSDHHPTNPVITPDQTICMGDVPLSLSVTINPLINAGSVSYQWSPISGNQNSISVSPVSTTTYYVTISRPCQSDTVLQTTVTVVNPVTPIISTADLTLCIGQNGIYGSSSILPPNANASWVFSGGTPSTANGLGSHSVSWNSSGNHSVTLEIDNEGCISDTSISVYVMPGPLNPQSTGDVTICENQSTVIGVSINPAIDPNSVTYSWSPVSGNTASLSVSPLVSTTYQVSVTTPCEDTVLTILVTVVPIVPASFSVTQNPICVGDTIEVAYSGTVASGMTLDWTFSSGLPSSANGAGPHAVRWDSPGAYNVSLTLDNNGCISDSTIFVNVMSGPEIIINTEDAHCGQHNGSAECIVLGSNPNCLFEWSNLASTNMITNLQSGTYSVTVTSEFGCKTVGSVNISDIPGPEAEFTYSPHVIFSSNPDVHFYDQSFPNVVSWLWDFGDQSGVSVLQNPVYVFPQVGFYTVVLEVVDSWGCVDTVRHIIHVKDKMTLYFPNAFSPNGDGSNDSFGPSGTMIDDSDFEFYIFDRWGKLLFLTTNVNVRWDGTYEGHKVEPGVYSWVIYLREEGGHIQRFDGHVTVVK